MWRLIPVLALAACAGHNLLTVEQECGAGKRPFPDTWPCVKVGLADLPGAPDLKRYYVSTGDVVAERIRTGKMTEAEGALVMSRALTEAQNATHARYAATRE